MTKATKIYWSDDELQTIAREFVRLFGKKKVKRRLLDKAQLALPENRRRTLIFGQKRAELDAAIRQLQAGDDLDTPLYESTTRLRADGVVEIGRSVPAVQPVIEAAPKPVRSTARPSLVNLSHLVHAIEEPVNRLPRYVGIDTEALSSCANLLEQINLQVLHLKRIDGATMDNIASHPVDFARLRALTIQAADGLSRFEEALAVAHQR